MHTTSSSAAWRSRTANRASRRAATRAQATTRPVTHHAQGTASTAASNPSWRIASPMTHRAVRPSRAPPRRRATVTPEQGPTPARRPPDGRPAELPKDDGRQENSPRTQSENQTGDQDRDNAGRDDEELERRAPTIPPAPQPARHPAAALRRPREDHREARGTRTTNRLRSGHPAGHSSGAKTIGIVDIRTA